MSKDGCGLGEIQLFSGNMFNPLQPDVSKVSIKDIAHALSMQCRYGGHAKFFYSVGEHSVHVSNILRDWGCDTTTQLGGLLHDCDEGLGLPDVPRPVKKSLVGYREYGERVQQAVFEKYGLGWPMHPSIVVADNSILFLLERKLLMGDIHHDHWRYDGELRECKAVIEGWSPEKSEKNFLDKYDELWHCLEAAA